MQVIPFGCSLDKSSKGSKRGHLALLRQNGCFAFDGEDLKDFSDTAALVDLMDLVITVELASLILPEPWGSLSGYCCPPIPIGDGCWSR